MRGRWGDDDKILTGNGIRTAVMAGQDQELKHMKADGDIWPETGKARRLRVSIAVWRPRLVDCPIFRGERTKWGVTRSILRTAEDTSDTHDVLLAYLAGRLILH